MKEHTQAKESINTVHNHVWKRRGILLEKDSKTNLIFKGGYTEKPPACLCCFARNKIVDWAQSGANVSPPRKLYQQFGVVCGNEFLCSYKSIQNDRGHSLQRQNRRVEKASAGPNGPDKPTSKHQNDPPQPNPLLGSQNDPP